MRSAIRWTPLLIASALFASACRDDASPLSPVTAPESPAFSKNESEAARGVFHRYVAIGTSVSMGWASDGAIAASQEQAWPLQLARRAGRSMTAPYLAFPGCRSPLKDNLLTFSRLSGEPAGKSSDLLDCSPTLLGVSLPVANTAINAARALDALNTTPETITDLSNNKLYARVLPPKTTQVMAMERQNPKFVSVELGANEVLGASSGVVIPGGSVFPGKDFEPYYDAILDRVARTVNTGAVLVGLVNDARSFPAFRRGHELWENRLEFAAFKVEIQPDCQNSNNYIVVPFRVPAAVGKALLTGSTVLFSCAASPNRGFPDYVLDPTEMEDLNVIIDGIDDHIRQQAETRRWAYFRLEALYGRPGLKEPFSVVKLMTTATPYGPLMSLDGFHPSAAGQTVLADTAASAINARYRLGIPVGFSALIAAP